MEVSVLFPDPLAPVIKVSFPFDAENDILFRAQSDDLSYLIERPFIFNMVNHTTLRMINCHQF